jgi:hypothetical protein
MRRRAGNRKGNYASNVKGTMPTAAVGSASQGALYKHNIPLNIWHRRKKTLDNTPKCIIIIFTVGAARARVAHAGERSQTRGSATTRDSESASPRRDRRAVCQRQLFRSQRSRPGQVRDAAPGAERGSLGDWRRDGFRLLPALVLSSAGCLRGGWARWTGSSQTRPQAGAQAHRRGPGLHCRDASERACCADTGTGAADPRTFRDKGSSTKHRTQPAASSKKTPRNESSGQPIAPPDLTEQYEQLRREATGRSEHEVQGLGLALFLRRGMTAWMQAWSQCTGCAAPNTHPRPATPAAVPRDLRTQIATLLAGIILGLQQEATS